MKSHYLIRKSNIIETEAEIKPSWKYIPVILLIAVLIVILQSDFFSLFVSDVYADTFIWRSVDRERPGDKRLVWVDWGVCRHLARYDARAGWFYDNKSWVNARKWVYVMDERQPALRPCTSEDLP